MGLIGKARETGTKVLGNARDRLDDVKDRRRVDDLLQEIGTTVFHQRSGRGRPDDDLDIDRLVTELHALEIEGVDVVDPRPGDPRASGS